MLHVRAFRATAGQVSIPTAMVQLGESLGATRTVPWSPRPHLQRPIRGREAIEAAFESGDTGDFRLVEWMMGFGLLRDWDVRDPGRADRVARLMWQAGRQRSALGRIMTRKLILGAMQPASKKSALWRVFAQREIHEPDPAWMKIHQILACLGRETRNQARALAELACSWNETVPAMITGVMGPPGAALIEPAIVECPAVFVGATRTRHAEAWLLQNLEEMNPGQQRDAVLYLLRTLTDEQATRYGRLVLWLQAHYQELSAEIGGLPGNLLARLRQWVGAVNYGDFEKLIQKLLASGLVSDDYLTNQLRRRSAFWSNYRDRFSNLRILLPSSSSAYFEMTDLATEDVLVLKADGTLPTHLSEICLFDFDTLIVIEFFRGPSSETILLEGTDEIRRALFENRELSIRRLRHIGMVRNGVWLDHEFLWQRFHERALFERGIQPNLTRGGFRWDPDAPPWSYHPRRGPGPDPTLEKLEDREVRLVRWHQRVREGKYEARQWAIANGLIG